MENQELIQRIDIIEKMISEGRREVESWGWIFVLWGLGYVLATVVVHFFPHPVGAIWGIVMTACGVVVALWGMHLRRRRRQVTTTGRAIGSVWWSLAITLFLSSFVLGSAGKASSITTTVLLSMGLVNFASGLILRWKIQTAVGILWWLSFVGFIFSTGRVADGIVLGMEIVGLILFGIYLMILERQERRRGEVT
jgi:hypothetical protein